MRINSKRNNLNLILLSSLSMAVLSGCGGSDPAPEAPIVEPPPTASFPTQVVKPNVSVINDNGSLIIAESGLSLYTFDNDSVGTSNCEGSADDTSTCAGKWPPLLVGDGASADDEMTIITRSDGEKQWALKGMPLYQWYQDSAQGDINGDGVNGVWHLARPMPLKTAVLKDVNSYVGNQTIASVTSASSILTSMRIDKEGFTLYTFDKDPLDDSACADECINIWPPLLADSGAMAMPPLSIITASNGNSQWAYKSKPLYFFKNDGATGDINGDDVKDVWHVATQEPAIQRTTENGRSLSATGNVNVLASVGGSITEFEVTEMDKDGFSLYTFDNDSMEQSNCEGQCLEIWPAFVPSDGDVAIGSFTIFDRADGTKQWSYDGMPVYFFKNDASRGDINGDGVKGVWHLVLPAVLTSLKEESNALGATITVDGDVHVMLRDPETMEFVDQVEDKSDFALYTFDKDTAGVSNCLEGCLDIWPPLLADKKDVAEAPFSIITRDDNGMKQWAINGMPLYFFTPDATAEDTNGENVKSVWHMARPAPVKVDEHETEGALLAAHGDVLDSQGKTAAQLAGLTLYTFDSDVVDSGVSECFDGCAVTWPPLYATAEDQAFGEFTIISREENDTTTFQWSYQGLPLYFYVGDSAIGDTNGDYTSWTIARP